jgi:hypothetical protein
VRLLYVHNLQYGIIQGDFQLFLLCKLCKRLTVCVSGAGVAGGTPSERKKAEA